MYNMGVLCSIREEKLDINKLEIINNYEFEIFFLHILLNNPRFSLFLLNQDYKKNTYNKSKLFLQEMAYKLLLESEHKKVINSSNFINEFNKINNYIIYSSRYLDFLKKFLSIEFWKTENNILKGVNNYNKSSATQTQKTSIN